MNKVRKSLASIGFAVMAAGLACADDVDAVGTALTTVAGKVGTYASNQTTIIAGLVGIILAGLAFYFFKVVVKSSK